MATPPTFSSGSILTAAQMNSVGLWLVKTQAVGTGVSSVTVTGAFSADYDNYRIVYSNGTMSVATAIKMTLGGIATGYYGTLIYGEFTGGLYNASDNNNTNFSYVGGGGNDGLNLSVDVFNPFATKTTRIGSNGIHWSTNFGVYNGVHTGTQSHTLFNIAPLSGTFTGGTIRVYGYRN